MITFEEVHLLDRNSEHFGVPPAQLMENAGKGAAEVIGEKFDLKGKTVVVLVGKGNNGGDGLVMARYLSGLCNVGVIPLYSEDECSELNRENLRKLPDSVEVSKEPDAESVRTDLSKADMVVDALLGIGISSEPREPIKGAVLELNAVKVSREEGKVDTEVGAGGEGNGKMDKDEDGAKNEGKDIGEDNKKNVEKAEEDRNKEKNGDKGGDSAPRVVSLDIATGINTSLAVRPDMTVTFHDVKKGMNPGNSGEIVVIDIGIPKEATTHVGPGDFIYFPEPAPSSHKGQNGVVMVIGGGPYVGAPVLSSLASLRAGADLAHLFVPEKIHIQASSFSPEIIVHPLAHGKKGGGHFDMTGAKQCQKFSEKCDAIVIGPGLGRYPDTLKAVFSFIHWVKIPIILDADALNALSNQTHVLKYKDAVLTPHRGEFKTLFNLWRSAPDFEALVETVEQKSYIIRTTILLKGQTDIISDGKKVLLNTTGHPSMTTGGTGDVLSGIVGALLAKGLPPFKAARLASFISGKAGEFAAEERSWGLTASDVIDRIPRVIKSYMV